SAPVLHPGAGEHVIDPRGLRGPSPSSEFGVEGNDEPRAEEPPVERRALGHVLLEEVAQQGDELGVARGSVSDVVPGRRDRGPDQVVYGCRHLTTRPVSRLRPPCAGPSPGPDSALRPPPADPAVPHDPPAGPAPLA